MCSAFLFRWLERWRKQHEEPELVADEDRLLCALKLDAMVLWPREVGTVFGSQLV